MAVRVGDRQVESGLGRFLVPLGGLLGIIVLVIGIKVLADPRAGQNLLAFVYDLIGNTSGATALRNGQGDVLTSKILLAVVAIVIGVGGVWMLFTGVSALVTLLPPRWQSRILP